MKPFRFTLQRVLDLRSSRLEEEERKLAALEREWNSLDEEIQRIERSRQEAGLNGAHIERVSGHELRAMVDYKAKLTRDQVLLMQKKAVCAQRMAKQREDYLAARRECRLLEKLRSKQLAEWELESGREQDRLASELYLARWKGGTRPPQGKQNDES